jgi:hypothetical protein
MKSVKILTGLMDKTNKKSKRKTSGNLFFLASYFFLNFLSIAGTFRKKTGIGIFLVPSVKIETGCFP